MVGKEVGGNSDEQIATTDETTEADKQQVGRSTKCRLLSISIEHGLVETIIETIYSAYTIHTKLTVLLHHHCLHIFFY